MNCEQCTIFTFPSPEDLAEHLSAFIIECLSGGVEEKDRASLVVSGGSTPKHLFDTLSGQDFNWAKVTVSLVDERWVAPTHPDSNEKLVRDTLLQNKARTARFVGLKNRAATALEGEEECHRQLMSVPRPFDTVVLGMGSDGHTASLFPGAEKLREALDMHSPLNCLAVSPEGTQHSRMTLTLPVILDARQIILHITGEEKKALLEHAMQDGPVTEMPVRAILRQQMTPVRIYWAP